MVPGTVYIDWRNSRVERELVKAGFHPSGDWWVDLIERYLIDGPRIVVVRAGRRAGKTTHALRAILNDALSRAWRIDPGDVGIIAIISARKPQAEDRVATMKKYIEALGLEIVRDNNQRIDFVAPWGLCSVRAMAAASGDVVGGTWIACLLDEVARWIDDRGRNPATEVIASAKPSLLSTGGTMWMISSPMGLDDAHAKAFAKGDGTGQMVAHAETWVACSELYTEADCHLLEPDEILFKREYAAVPMSTDGTHWLNHHLIEAATLVDMGALISVKAGGDLAFMRDAAGLSLNGLDIDNRIGTLYVHEWRPENDMPLDPTHTVGEALAMCKAGNATSVMTDQWARANMIAASRAHGVLYKSRPENGAHWEFARRALLTQRLALPSCDMYCACDGSGTCNRLLEQLRRVRVMADGDRLKYDHARIGGAHGDLAEAWACGVYQLRHGSTDTESIMQGQRAAFGGRTTIVRPDGSTAALTRGR